MGLKEKTKQALKVVKDIWRIEEEKRQWGGMSFPLAAVSRFFLAQMIFRFRDSFKFKWIHGIKMEAIRHRAGTTECYYLGKYDYEEMSLIERYVSPDVTLVDVGANIGSYALLSAAIGGKAIAFEPVASTYGILKKNIAMNDFDDKIRTMQTCVANEKGEVFFSDSFDTENRIISENEARIVGGYRVPSDTLDNLLADIKGDIVLKIDVEGAELDVLNGADKILSSDRCKLVVIESFETREAICEILFSRNFKLGTYSVDSKKIKEIQLSETDSNNLIFYK